MKRIAIALGIVVAMATGVAAADYKIGTVNLQRALNESEAGQKAKEKFKKEVDELQTDLESQKKKLEAMKADFEKKGMVLKEDQRKELEREYQRKLRDFRRTYKDAQNDLKTRDNEMTAEILEELQKVIAEYGPQHDYTLILEASNTGAVLYRDDAVDITDEIIEVYDARKQ